MPSPSRSDGSPVGSSYDGDIKALEGAGSGLEANKGLTYDQDIKRMSSAGVQELAEGDSYAIDPKAERALVWKFDLRVLPVLAVMYLFNSLDKSNLGNAKTAGLEKSLGLMGQDFNSILSIFYVPVIAPARLAMQFLTC